MEDNVIFQSDYYKLVDAPQSYPRYIQIKDRYDFRNLDLLSKEQVMELVNRLNLWLADQDTIGNRSDVE